MEAAQEAAPGVFRGLPFSLRLPVADGSQGSGREPERTPFDAR